MHQSELLQSNTVVVQGRDGVLLVDPGITGDELAASRTTSAIGPSRSWRASRRIRTGTTCSGTPTSATRRGTAPPAARRPSATCCRTPDWAGPRRRGAAAGDRRGHPDGPARPRSPVCPPARRTIPWDGPTVRIIEHRAHAPGHAALLIEERGVLVAGDMLSDILMPFLDLRGTSDPLEDYLAALRAARGRGGRASMSSSPVTGPSAGPAAARTDRAGPRVRPRPARRPRARRPADRPVRQARLGVGGRPPRGAGREPRARAAVVSDGRTAPGRADEAGPDRAPGGGRRRADRGATRASRPPRAAGEALLEVRPSSASIDLTLLITGREHLVPGHRPGDPRAVRFRVITNEVSLRALNGLSKTRSTRTREGSVASTTVIRPAPALRLPDQA